MKSTSKVPYARVFAIAVILLALGCAAELAREPETDADSGPAEPIVEGSRDLPARQTTGASFGLPNTFSGELSEELKRMVPETLQGVLTAAAQIAIYPDPVVGIASTAILGGMD